MPEIQQNRYDQLLRRVTGSIGPGSRVSESITELFPMIDVENLPPELLVLAGWSPAFRGTDITAGVGDLNASQLFNPLGSGKIMVLTTVILTISGAAGLRTAMTHTELASSNGFGVLRDNRAGDIISTAAVGNTRIETGFTVNAGGNLFLSANRAETLEDRNGLAILTPGDGWSVGTDGTNLRLIVSYYWRERTAEQSELNF
ncbi:MAG: hypothetical protein V3S55_15730 [Nitrospiraceae bacterium]